MRGPVERAEEGAGGDGRVGGVQRAGADAGGDEGADATLVLISREDDAGAEPWGERVDLEVRGGAFDLVDQAEDVRDGHGADPRGQRAPRFPRRGQRVEQPIRGAVLAEEQELVLAGEIVIQVAEREVGGGGDVAHAGGGEAAGAEDARRRAHDRRTAGVGPD